MVTILNAIEEVFLELDYDEASDARVARDKRVEELTSQGLQCSVENLFTVYGHRVFLVRAEKPEPEVQPRFTRRVELPEGRAERPERKDRERQQGSDRPRRKLPQYEER